MIKKLFFIVPVVGVMILGCSPSSNFNKNGKQVKFTKEVLQDKIKGGWAGQTIGCTYGGPTEFKYNGTIMHDYIPVEWDSTKMKWWYDHGAGLYDDIYMDLTFVDVFEKYGLKAPVDSFANAFANASYTLWHANQAARFNLLNGIKAPQSGHWLNNPHADDIDFQIEADFAGLMAPALPNVASVICDSIGHIMNYGDGWYGGVYVANMYSLAFISDDINWVVREALRSIPAESKYRRCMEFVIANHKKYPDDWKKTWFEVERYWDEDFYCPDGLYSSFNIDALINSAYILIGLLYGEGDFTKTMDISMRCGQDSDCNPSSAAGILGTMIGYSKIPERYLEATRIVEDRNFSHTTISLNDAYKLGYKHALEIIQQNNGKINGEEIEINYESPKPVRLEIGFNGHYPLKKAYINKGVEKIGEYEFTGNAIVFKGNVEGPKNYIAEIEMYIDGKLTESVKLPVNHTIRRDEISFKYGLQNATHTVTFKWKNPAEGAKVIIREALIYGDKPLIVPN